MTADNNLELKLKHYRISRSEYELIEKQLGRPPQGLEWALYSALWSEHCSYKSSKVHLRKFYSKSKRVVSEEGENAGIIDLGEGERVAFKMESHNHPSFIEPYQGAATGVGGILRDIFTMGARPVMLANYLCFGRPEAARMSSLVDGVVRGIAGYGNCVGVPTVTGQTEFDSSYDKNILVNALAVGLFRPGEKIFLSAARGVGNLVVYVGAKTGKDGVHGASMASESFDDKNEKKKPTIQKGDPFFEKLLIESCLEVMRENLVVAIQDMGAAGLTSSSFEMAAKGQVSLEMHLDRVPLRDSSMQPEEILLSESQERMLLICEPHNLKKIQSVFAKWDLDAAEIGKIVETPLGRAPTVRLFWKGEKACEIDPLLLVDQAPRYERPYDSWSFPKKVSAVSDLKIESARASHSSAREAGQKVLALLSSAEGTGRDWIYNQYDQRVGAKTAADCSEPVGVIRLPDSKRALGLVLGCRPAWMRLDAHVGGADAVAYPALELAAKGFEPLAVTDCLNFGNPENKKIMSEFVASIEAISKQCEKLDAPVISGNVSFYNETLGQNITSTPATGLVGLRQSVDGLPKSRFLERGDEVWILDFPMIFSDGEKWAFSKNPQASSGFDFSAVAEVTKLVRVLAASKAVRSSRVVGQKGLAHSLARMCLPENRDGQGFGCEVDVSALNLNAGLFHDVLYRVIFAVRSDFSADFKKLFSGFNSDARIQLIRLGAVRGSNLKIRDGESVQLDLPINEMKLSYFQSWEKHFEFMA